MDRVTFPVEGFLPAARPLFTPRVAAVAAMFGLRLDAGDTRTLFPRREITVGPGDLLLITGPSGAGKSTLLRAIEAALRERSIALTRLENIPAPADRAAVDALDCPLDDALAHLARAGLSEAHLLVRPPATFSEGQRFRFRLAHFFASDARLLIADEFAATLDRLTARVISWQLGKFLRTSGKAAVLATTHDDLAADLRPTLHLWKGLDDTLSVCPPEPLAS